ncbi:DUF6241 domain-containing protein [Metabacillus herbersteinensis]|uniref:DUF6241 domain-containing protein n=1 Tax=Metabacillus herbersteinensis TaxID=283816 RepID=A0ABV6G884_9BACI
MKKFLVILGISVIAIGATGFGAFKFMENAEQQLEKDNKLKEQADHVQVAKEKEEKEIKEQTAKIGGVEYDTGLTFESTQNVVIDVMHKMTHQKVKAEDKWGAIPMISDTINTVYDIISSSNFELKDDLLEIATRWKDSNFNNVVEDHNFFWEYQGGTIGKAYGQLSSIEEETFVLNNFGEEIARE